MQQEEERGERGRGNAGRRMAGAGHPRGPPAAHPGRADQPVVGAPAPLPRSVCDTRSLNSLHDTSSAPHVSPDALDLSESATAVVSGANLYCTSTLPGCCSQAPSLCTQHPALARRRTLHMSFIKF